MKEKVSPLVCWTHAACTRLATKEEYQVSALKHEWRLFSNCTDESFEWVSKHPDKITGHKLPKLIPKEGFFNPSMQITKVEKPIETENEGQNELTQTLKTKKQL